MRLTRAGDYAVRCLYYLSAQKEGIVTARKEIAREMDIPEQFLAKIARQLSRVGIIEIVQGPKGGFRLIVSSDKLNLLDAVEAVMGEIFLNDCLMRPESCARSGSCAVNMVWERARNQLRETLREATFDKLLKDESCLGNLMLYENQE